MKEQSFDIENALNGLNGLTVFGNVKRDPAFTSLAAFLDLAPEAVGGHGSLRSAAIKDLSDFAERVIRSGDLTGYIFDILKNGNDPYLTRMIHGDDVPETLKNDVDKELEILNGLSLFTPLDAVGLISPDDHDIYIPEWEKGPLDIKKAYNEMILGIPSKGYGVFLDHSAFKISKGKLVPVLHPDCQSLSSLYGYERERKEVLENTRALAAGKHAANVLLYGDAGTGKSSTIKACANEFRDEGVRLIEFSKEDISSIPEIIDKLYDSPLRFIFFIDDLSFTSEDDDFCFLKGILEGTVTERPDNTVIYATSNRRHLVREDSEDRKGSDIHVNDTLQQTMSLAARFGIVVTFQRPGKDLYLEIVDKLAKEKGIDLSEERLFLEAERFALRANGRSPRTAKQFIELLLIKNS